MESVCFFASAAAFLESAGVVLGEGCGSGLGAPEGFSIGGVVVLGTVEGVVWKAFALEWA